MTRIKQNLKISCIIFIIINFCLGCTSITCFEYYDKTFRKKHYRFCVKEKYRDSRYYVFTGHNVKGEIEKFEEIDFGNLYDKTEIGDTIRKDSCKITVLLIKRDTVFQHTISCGGELIE